LQREGHATPRPAAIIGDGPKFCPFLAQLIIAAKISCMSVLKAFAAAASLAASAKSRAFDKEQAA